MVEIFLKSPNVLRPSDQSSVCSYCEVNHPILITKFAGATGLGSLGKKLHETLSLVGFITLKALSYSRIYIANVVFREYFVFCLQDKRVYCLAIKLRIQKMIDL